MKKILGLSLGVALVLFITGCTINNTPTKKVEAYLNSYKTLDENVVNQIDSVIKEDNDMTDDEKETYKSAIKRQYKDLTYVIKNETIDGDNATVTVEIEVYDFYKTNEASDRYYQDNQDEFKSEDGTLSDDMLIDYRIKQLTTAKERIKYTVEFRLSKTNNTWKISDVDDITIQKIHGLYAH